MRSIWKGSIAFGLVNVPVKVYSATDDHDVKFHQVHAADSGRIKYDRRCTVCGEVVPFADIDKAYESPDGKRIVLSDDDLNTLPAAEKHEIPVLEFVPSDQIDPILYDRTYYLEPDSANPKAYVLLRETLKGTERTALVHFTLRQKTRLAALRVHGELLVIQTLLWPDEVREARFEILDDAAEPRPKELAMAETLVDSMSGDFDPSEYTDDYQIELRKLLDDMIANGGEKVTTAEPEDQEQDAEVVDLVAALERSVAAAKGKKSPDKKAPDKKAPDKKATGKKSPDKESTDQESPRRASAGG